MWKKTTDFFENGDLVPFAVGISIWHFAGALMAHGENIAVAIAAGILVDMLHFRTVRHAVAFRQRSSILVAVLTTAMSYCFHLLFYVTAHGESSVAYNFEYVAFLLAAPLPIGIPILAWQQNTKTAGKKTDELAELKLDYGKLESEFANLKASYGKLESEFAKSNDLLTTARNENGEVMQERDSAHQDVAKLQKELTKARRIMATQYIELGKLPERIAYMAVKTSQGIVPNGDMAKEFNMGANSVERMMAAAWPKSERPKPQDATK